jgi:menaquinone-specific isochorismate synthase
MSSRNINNSFFVYVQPIGKDLFGKALLAINHDSDSCFYWNNPDSNEIFLAIDELLKINDVIHPEDLYFISNKDEFQLERIPEILVSIKFPSNKTETIWEAFEHSNFFIPKFIFFQKEKSYYFIIFFHALENKTSEIIIEEIDQRLEKIISYKTKNQTQAKLTILNNLKYDEWKGMVNHSLQKIGEGKIRKVVLSRYLDCEINNKPDLTLLTRKLKEDYPDSYIFIYRKSDSIFLGASPEKLFVINKKIIETEALAGTVKRGESDYTDNQLSDFLLNDRKELAEHNNVVEYIVSTISEFADGIQFDKPSVKKLKYVQHLWTPIKGTLTGDYSVNSIINKLHPTPAVCGDPRTTALELINYLENFERGLFTGVIGWYSNNGFGELAVAIRSALIRKNKLLLFAGCGIVEGSTPEKEFYETELKLKSILSLFQHEPAN